MRTRGEHRNSQAPAPRSGGAGRTEFAQAYLGPAHRLVALTQRWDRLVEQLVVVGCVMVLGAVAAGIGAPPGLPLAVSASLVGLGLVARLVLLSGDRREAALQLISEGGGLPPIPCVERHKRELEQARHRAKLARFYDQVARDAVKPIAHPLNEPLFHPATVRVVLDEIRAVAALLERDDVTVAGVALAELLAMGCASALYGRDAVVLRQELRRTIFLLTVRRI
jgi:hypothetical protein